MENEADVETVRPEDLEKLFFPSALKKGVLPLLCESVEKDISGNIFFVEDKNGEVLHVLQSLTNHSSFSTDTFIHLMPFLFDPLADSVTMWSNVRYRMVDNPDDESAKQPMEGDPSVRDGWNSTRLNKDLTIEMHAIGYGLDDEGHVKFDDKAMVLFKGDLTEVVEDSELQGSFPKLLLRIITTKDAVFNDVLQHVSIPARLNMKNPHDRTAVALAAATLLSDVMMSSEKIVHEYGVEMQLFLDANIGKEF